MNVLMRSRRGALELAGTLAALAITGAVVIPSRMHHGFAVVPEHFAHAHELESFDDPTSLIAASDLVVVGTVLGAHPGKTRGDVGGEQLTDRLVTLQVSDVLRGPQDVAVGNKLEVLEGFWDPHREGVAVNDVAWAPDNAKGVYFLHRMANESVYRQSSSYGRLLYNAPEDVTGPSGEDPSTAGPWRNIAASDLRTLAHAAEFVRSLCRELP